MFKINAKPKPKPVPKLKLKSSFMHVLTYALLFMLASCALSGGVIYLVISGNLTQDSFNDPHYIAFFGLYGFTSIMIMGGLLAMVNKSYKKIEHKNNLSVALFVMSLQDTEKESVLKFINNNEKSDTLQSDIVRQYFVKYSVAENQQHDLKEKKKDDVDDKCMDNNVAVDTQKLSNQVSVLPTNII